MAGLTTADRRASGQPESGPARPSSGPGPGGPGKGRGGTARLRRRRTLAVLLVLAVLLGGFGTWALYGSDWLRIEDVRVGGARALTEEQILRAAEVPVGAPMISLDSGATERRLRERLPRIRSAEVVRAWPRGVRLKVTERRPELLQKAGEDYLGVDTEGVRFAARDAIGKGIPLLVMDLRKTPASQYFGPARLRQQAARVAAALPDSVRRATRAVRVRSYDSLTLELTGGRTVLWGNGEHSGAKARALLALMKAEKSAGRFDVSVPSAPAASPS